MRPIQRILFGSPGTGKSCSIRNIAINSLKMQWDEENQTIINSVKTVFHPEYTYSDFIGKLLPQTFGGGNVIYKFYEGHFIRSLGIAYKLLIDGSDENVLLVIDELNRGNASAIFGSIFQLLDREENGWSSYEVDVSGLELVGLLNSMSYRASISAEGDILIRKDGRSDILSNFCDSSRSMLSSNQNALRVIENIKRSRISIPPNLSIIATINTSDDSIYYLDSAFKRRWDWDYIDAPDAKFHSYSFPEGLLSVKLEISPNEKVCWTDFVIRLNEFLKANSKFIRRIEDKQIGWWFIKPIDGKINLDSVKNKLMFYLWDSVFTRDKQPLIKLLKAFTSKDISLITYADFVTQTENFVHAIWAEYDYILTVGEKVDDDGDFYEVFHVIEDRENSDDAPF